MFALPAGCVRTVHRTHRRLSPDRKKFRVKHPHKFSPKDINCSKLMHYSRKKMRNRLLNAKGVLFRIFLLSGGVCHVVIFFASCQAGLHVPTCGGASPPFPPGSRASPQKFTKRQQKKTSSTSHIFHKTLRGSP